MQVVTVADEDVVGLLVDLDVQVARGTTTGTDFALSRQPDPHAVADARGDLHADLATRPHPPVAAAAVARIGNDLADARAHRARTRRHHLAEQRPLHGLDLALAVAGVAGGRSGVAVGALALAHVAEDRGVHGDVLGDAGRALRQVEPHPQQRIGSRPDPSDGPAGTAAATEERLEHVAKTTETGAAETAAEAVACARALQRIATEVDDAALLRITENLVGRRDLLELSLRRLVGVDVGMQFARELAVRALDLRIARTLAHTEQTVIIACHAKPF